jgi:hypothetical protein
MVTLNHVVSRKSENQCLFDVYDSTVSVKPAFNNALNGGSNFNFFKVQNSPITGR